MKEKFKSLKTKKYLLLNRINCAEINLIWNGIQNTLKIIY
jgi:hypothetical protein